MSFDINKLVRENIKKLTPYSSARDEFKGEARVALDANENSLGSPVTPTRCNGS
jgi:histidinol-phosphate aminotransferase